MQPPQSDIEFYQSLCPALNKNLEIDAYKVDANTLFTQANMQGSLLLGDKLDEILAKEQEWLDELERTKTRC